MTFTLEWLASPMGVILKVTPSRAVPSALVLISLFPNKETQVEFQNYQRPTLKIVKVDINGKHRPRGVWCPECTLPGPVFR